MRPQLAWLRNEGLSNYGPGPKGGNRLKSPFFRAAQVVARSFLACPHLASLKKVLFADCHLSGRDIVILRVSRAVGLYYSYRAAQVSKRNIQKSFYKTDPCSHLRSFPCSLSLKGKSFKRRENISQIPDKNVLLLCPPQSRRHSGHFRGRYLKVVYNRNSFL